MFWSRAVFFFLIPLSLESHTSWPCINDISLLNACAHTILLSSTQETVKLEDLPISHTHIYSFTEQWEKLDPESTGLIHVTKLATLMARLPPPLGVLVGWKWWPEDVACNLHKVVSAFSSVCMVWNLVWVHELCVWVMHHVWPRPTHSHHRKLHASTAASFCWYKQHHKRWRHTTAPDPAYQHQCFYSRVTHAFVKWIAFVALCDRNVIWSAKQRLQGGIEPATYFWKLSGSIIFHPF